MENVNVEEGKWWWVGRR